MRLLLTAAVLTIACNVFGQDLMERKDERTLDDGTKILTISRNLSGETFWYKPDGTFRKHVIVDHNRNGPPVSKRSYDAEGRLLAFQIFSYDREWKLRTSRIFNSAGNLILYFVYEPKGEKIETTVYTSDRPNAKPISVWSPEYPKIVSENHLEALQ